MSAAKIFYMDESACQPGKFLVRVNLDAFNLKYTEGSFNVICARVFGITYAEYLRMCRDCFGAEIIGKGAVYPIAYFKSSKEAKKLIDDLNARANEILRDCKEKNNV